MSGRLARCLLTVLIAAPTVIAAAELPPPGADGPSQRKYQVAVLARIAEPVLAAGSAGKLKERIPKLSGARNQHAPLEALGRTLSGIAPWLELGPGTDDEGRLRARFIDMALKSIGEAVDSNSSGYLNFKGNQALVDTAFLAQALLRAPKQLWGNLDEKARNNVAAALRSTRSIKAFESNWLLFSATIEAALLQFTGECEMEPIDHAVNQHLKWYLGDGTYGDGPKLQWDYYNSFVIHPMLWEVLEICAEKKLPLGQHYEVEQKRARRYAQVLERMISPEGTFPVIGRSSTYRFGAFQVLSMMALRHQLPPDVTPAGVRSGLNAVIQRMIEAPDTFDAEGWLRVGVVGAQPKAADPYINSGSVYLCTFGLLQLGLPADDPFWIGPNEPWTQKRIWAGENIPADHAIDN